MEDMVFTVSMLISTLHLNIQAPALSLFMEALTVSGLLDPAVTADEQTLSFTAQVESDSMQHAMRTAASAAFFAMGATFGLAGANPDITHVEAIRDEEPMLEEESHLQVVRVS